VAYLIKILEHFYYLNVSFLYTNIGKSIGDSQLILKPFKHQGNQYPHLRIVKIIRVLKAVLFLVVGFGMSPRGKSQ